MGKQYKYGGCSGEWENDTNVVVIKVDGKTIQMWRWWWSWREYNRNVEEVVVEGN